ncbi:hypothetical protein BCT82_05430 [Vibrio breoganii]|uniref:hypothetical protein n=1 Tax=Vibrio breoganii TaxID=553239 RepID=UPI000C8625A6|nr:hypothetical protein [Vibrio breoganii]PML28905.1 hypothetical protein BCT82_05430 [Vibrio breoganii]
MSDGCVGSILPNGKAGFFPEKTINFDLSNALFVEKISSESQKKVKQISLLLESAPEVFQCEDNLVWGTINTVAEVLGITLTDKFLCSVYLVEGIELSIDSYFRHEGSQRRCSRLTYLGNSINSYVEWQYRFKIEKSCTEKDIVLAFDMFMCGGGLMTANYEPMISAGKSRTSDASLEKIRISRERRDICLKRRREILATNSKHSNASIASIIHKELGAELDISMKTIQSYFKGL